MGCCGIGDGKSAMRSLIEEIFRYGLMYLMVHDRLR